MTRKNSFVLPLMLASALALVACDYQKNNVIDQNDLRDGDSYVYGVHPDSAARQTKNKYVEKPINEQRAEKIRQKLYGQTNATGN
ncbi:MAG: hypothetical protein LH606_03670 [Cytophagaceae bacterium]|nr:hypothetical protein [Cytophagaceae bacterium]